MSYKYADLCALTDAQVIEHYDDAAEHTDVGTQYYQDELNRRSNDRLGRRMLHLTYASTGLAALAVVISVIALFAS